MGRFTPLQRVGAVTLGKAQGLPGFAAAQANDLEQLAHFMLHDQGLRLDAGGQGCAFHTLGQAAVDQKAGLAGVAQHGPARVLRGQRHPGEINVRGNVLAPDRLQRVGVGLVLLVGLGERGARRIGIMPRR